MPTTQQDYWTRIEREHAELVAMLDRCAKALAKEYGLPFEQCIALEAGEARALLARVADTRRAA